MTWDERRIVSDHCLFIEAANKTKESRSDSIKHFRVFICIDGVRAMVR